MREGREQKLQHLFLRERVLYHDLDHELAHCFDVRLLVESFCISLNLLEVLLLESNEALLKRGRVFIDQQTGLTIFKCHSKLTLIVDFLLRVVLQQSYQEYACILTADGYWLIRI